MPNTQTKAVGNTVYTMFTVERRGILEATIYRLVADGAVDFKITLHDDHWIVTAIKYSPKLELLGPAHINDGGKK